MNNKILVVGGVAGGASFAARMRRLDEHAQVIIFEKGDYVSFANCGLPYFIGKTIKNRDDLILQTPESFKNRFNIEVRIHSEITQVNPAKKTVSVKGSTSSYEETYDYLVLSPGCIPIRPPIPGIASNKIFTLRNISDMDRIDTYIQSHNITRTVIIGGGFIGLEMIENLCQRSIDVSVVELADQLLIPMDPEMAHMLYPHIQKHGVKVNLNAGAKEFIETQDNEIEVHLTNGTQLKTEMVILAIGVTPDTEFLKNSGLEINNRGGIIVKKNMQTNIDTIFAIGDAVEVTDYVSQKKVQVPLAGPANRQGRIVADVIAGIPSEYRDTQGTAICKIFEMSAAVTGLNEKNAQRYNITVTKSYTHSANHADYYPGSYPVSSKILFNEKTGTLLGAQIIGKEGVDKRIDIFATAIRKGLTISDLTELELAYAPPFGSAKDPITIAGYVAQNIMTKKMDVFYAEDIQHIDFHKQILLDVRTKIEHKNASIKNSLLIPIDELRERIDELDKNKEILVYCYIGQRGYLAARILVQNGFRVKNLSGGFLTYSFYVKK